MVDREQVLCYVKEKYGIEPDYPWVRTPNYAILRHKGSRKWFCAVIDITEDKLGLDGDRLIDAINLKCDPLLTGSFRSHADVFPGYHMNKEHWITVRLGGVLAPAELYNLIDLSYQLTK